MSRLADKVAAITGAGRGIGRAIALRFAEEGCDLALSDIDLQSAEDTAALAERNGVRASAFRADVTQRAEVEAMVKGAVEALGPLDILVNNAGIFFNSPFEEMTDEEWHRMMDTNLTSVFIVSQIVIRDWLARERGGVIVNMSSMSGEIAFTGSAHYCASKLGVTALTRCLGLEYGPRGIRANCIAPGIVRTDLNAHLDDQPEIANAWREKIPLKRFGKPEDVANVALFLASDESQYMTGEMVFVDGGWVLE